MNTPLVRLRKTVVMPKSTGFLSRAQRRWAWLGLVTLGLHAPVAAKLLPDASWLLSVCVAGMIAVLIIADDLERRRVGG
jgi:hypothetical protein